MNDLKKILQENFEDNSLKEFNIIKPNSIDSDLINIIEMKEFEKTITCCICSHIPLDPKCCKQCRNIYCNVCIKKLNPNSNCPTCKKNLVIDEFDQAARRMLDKIPITCPNNGCEMRIIVENINRHMKDCDFSYFKCKLCSATMPKQNISKHKLECSKMKAKCNKCEAYVFVKDCISHLELHNSIAETCSKIDGIEDEIRKFVESKMMLIDKLANYEKSFIDTCIDSFKLPIINSNYKVITSRNSIDTDTDTFRPLSSTNSISKFKENSFKENLNNTTLKNENHKNLKSSLVQDNKSRNTSIIFNTTSKDSQSKSIFSNFNSKPK